MGDVVLVRHGETAWSAARRHTGRTDLPLTPQGERQAAAVAPALAGRDFALVLVSPLQRARRTADLAGFPDAVADPDLEEWDYGDDEGRTTDEVTADHPGWNLWTDGPHGGEALAAIGARLDRVLARVRPALAAGDVLCVAHGHSLRVLTARWLGLTASGGAYFRLDTATTSELGFEHGRPVIARWNVPPGTAPHITRPAT